MTTTNTTATPAATAPLPPPPLIRVEQSGRHAELIIDTGHLLSSGRTWLAFARVPCANVFAARLLTENLRRRLWDAIAHARREAWEEGYNAALAGAAPRRHFNGTL